MIHLKTALINHLRLVALRCLCLGAGFVLSGFLVVDSCGAPPRNRGVAFCVVSVFDLLLFYINETSNIFASFKKMDLWSSELRLISLEIRIRVAKKAYITKHFPICCT